MAVEFIPVDRDSPYIFPPCVQDYLPDDHLARFVVDIVEQLDLSHLSAVYSGRGSKPFGTRKDRHMCTDEVTPRCCALALRCRRNTMALQNIANCLIG